MPEATLGGRGAAAPQVAADDTPAWRRVVAAPASLRHAPATPLVLLLIALWPHWRWMARRLSDGSDEPWGWLAIATVLWLVWSDRRCLAAPPPGALAVSAGLGIAAALLSAWLPPILAAAVALLALALLLTAMLPSRPAAPLAALLMLSLPLIASLQFYLGYPLRAATAILAAPVLRLGGLPVEASGAAFIFEGQIILVDPPCAGISMLWVGSTTAALLSYLTGADARRTALNGACAAACVFAGNVLRNVLLFFPESGVLPLPAVAHAAIGLLAFAVAVAAVAWICMRHRRRARPSSTEQGIGRVKQNTHRDDALYVGACLVAAVLPVLARERGAHEAVAVQPVSAAWPTHFRDQPLTQLAPTPLELRFADRFPGAVARFTDGRHLLILRQVNTPTRQLHPAIDCFRAAGYQVDAARAAAEPDGTRWRCFSATRATESLRVCERISTSLVDHDAAAWTDVSAWFWDALRRPAGHSGWWAVTLVAPLRPDDGETP